MTRNSEIARAVRRTLILSAVSTAGASLPIHAQDQPAQPPPAAAEATPPVLQEVVVTGSRITLPGLDAISPVTSVNAEQFKEQGVTKVEDLLNTLPQVLA